MFQKIGNFVDNFGKIVGTFLVAHPVVKNLLNGFGHAALAGFVAYLAPIFGNGHFSLQQIQAVQWSALGYAILMNLAAYAQSQHDVILAQVQDLAEYLLDSCPQRPGSVQPPPTTSSALSMPKALKVLMVGAFLAVLSGPAFGWDLPARSFKLATKMSLSVGAINPTAQGDTELDLIPTSSLGFGTVGPDQTPTYGWSGGYDLILDEAAASSTAGQVSVTPYLGIGGSFYVDLAPYFRSNGSPVVYGGFNVIGPQIMGLVPEAEWVWNLQTGEELKTINLAAPFGLLSGAGIVQVKQF
jgi:hypothetical protein